MKISLDRLTPEQQKRMLIGVILVVVVVYLIHQMLVKPRVEELKSLDQQIALMQRNIKTANQMIRSANEAAAESAEKSRNYIALTNEEEMPLRDPITWLPPRINRQLNSLGVEKPATAISETGDANVPGLENDFNTVKVSIDSGPVNFVTMGNALAALESREKLFEINSVSITGAGSDPDKQGFSLTGRFLLTKEVP